MKAATRASRNLDELRKIKITGTSPGAGTVSHRDNGVFASLRATQIVTLKPVLPAELMERILDFLSVADLATCARVCHQFQEMVYEDARWVQKLKAMGVWSDGDARQNFEDAMRKKMTMETQRLKHDEALGVQARNVITSQTSGTAVGRRHAGSVTLYDAGLEEQRLQRLTIQDERHVQTRGQTANSDGFTESPAVDESPTYSADPRSALVVMDHVRSIRGRARQEFAKVYGILGPLYQDVARPQGHSDPAIFRTFQTPEDQAQILSALVRFAGHDTALGSDRRHRKLETVVQVFETAVKREFEHGLVDGDVNGRMKRYAHVLCTLNRAQTGIDVFLSAQPVFQRTQRLGSPLECLEDVAPGHVDLNASKRFFEKLIQLSMEQAAIIQQVFTPTVDVLTPFIRRLCNEILADYITTLCDEAHVQGIETYVKAVSGTFSQALDYAGSIQPIMSSPDDFQEVVFSMVTACFEKHIDLYLAEEVDLFRSRSRGEVEHWNKEASEQQASAESYFMSNVSRQAAKRDFLSSFRKVVMLPVNAFPSPFSSSSSKAIVHKNTADLQSVDTSYSRSRSPTLTESSTPNRSGTPRPEAPTNELAAKTAIMNSRLEGIKSLFSIEVALNLTQFAKASLERAAVMVSMGGRLGDQAKQQCEVIFVELLHILGTMHIRAGFDKAVEHLSTYDPRQVREYRAKLTVAEPESDGSKRVAGVEPLMTFLELVNVGDLIQQMVDVFYNEELLAAKLIERDDFLSPAVKEKKRFEQMLDERVAAGLSKGIDVLMDEVEFLCATTQLATDFNPSSGTAADVDIGPSNTAQQVVEIVSSHTSMLIGSTDKTMLDVFMQEVALRLFGVLCKHFKRQRISVDGAIKLISDVNHYSAYVTGLKQKQILPYFSALRELGQIYLVYIDPPTGVFGGSSSGSGGSSNTSKKDIKRGSILSMKATKTQLQAKELAIIIADNQRYYGIFPAEEVYEFAERRADWYLVKSDVERAMYGAGCSIM